MSPSPKLRLGIARCLLGDEVRYDGTHKLDRYLRDILGAFVEFVPVCPEVECGMPVPREAMRLAGDPDRPAFVGRRSGADWTLRLADWSRERIAALAHRGLCGYVFQYGSPACGLSRVKVYAGGGPPRLTGVGAWARMVMDAFPLLPCEDDGRLRNPAIRENFVTRVFTLHRWREAMGSGPTQGRLVEFHSRHKLMTMAHSTEGYRALGKLVARAGSEDFAALCDRYLSGLLACLALKATPSKNANVLQHAMGYFKKDIAPDDKAELAALIEQYRTGLTPLIVPVTMINHYARKYGREYLAAQHYLHPFPAELMLRNHV
ncbi:MAG: DUF523 and DUF1722 domain-containing protein [Pseudodesulfovibrio sp.]